ncbi:flagellar biosynthetic protein FliR [Cellulosilyticum ruminicola]|uniref:flagellar biosynthetic protein FliR n=1 Tax=Cellulosilyticum ruminicola TaxID=425254 RepID=UPI0006D25C7D|nr:flagellar biosynthetic protein FliR [Cellulosilyticum ruminicola]
MEELMYLYTHIDVFLFIFCRIICAITFLPIITETRVPLKAISGMSVCLALVTVLTIGEVTITYNETLLGFTLAVLKEVFVGLIIGFSFHIYFQIYSFVASLWSTQGGLSMSTVMDPTSNTQVPALGKIYQLAFVVLFITSGGYHWFIQMVVESFKVIPLNQAIFSESITYTIIGAVTEYFLIGFKLAIPILSVLIIIDCGLGILARTVPQMNMFVIGIPLKMLILFGLIIITLNLLPTFNRMITDGLTNTIMNLIQGMMPQ